MSFIQTLRLLYFYVKPYRWKFLFGIFALLAVDLLNVFPPLVLKSFIDQAARTFEGDKRFAPFFGLGLLYAGIAFGQGIARYCWRMFLIQGSFKASEKLRDEYFKKLQKLPSDFYDRSQIGDLMSLATNDVEAVRFALGPGILVFADAVFFLLFIPPAMFWLSPKLALVSLAPMVMVPFIIMYVEKLIHDRFDKVQAQFSKLSAFSQENLEGIRIIKAFVREWTQITRFSSIGREFVKLNLKLAKVQSIFEPLFMLALALGLVSLFLFAGKDVMAGIVGLGTFVAFTRYLDQLVWPMMAFGLSVTYYERGKTSLARILKVLNQREEPLVVSHSIVEEYSQRIEEGKNAQEGHSDVLIEACNLTFYYPGQSHPALKNVSFRIEKGKRTALVGTIGSGKSTIVRLLLGLYEVPPGMLFWNGVDVTSISLEKRREKIAVVPQDVFLFRETLKWNILLGTNEDTFVKDKRFYEILVKAGLEKEFQIWGLDKKIAERGLNLSGGQRARVALARAMIRNAALLILDDALSSVDIRMENEILEHLQHDAHLSQTLLMVTHRFSKLGRFDHVLVLKDGEVVQSGSPQGLARVSGLYRQLLELQRMENELAR